MNGSSDKTRDAACNPLRTILAIKEKASGKILIYEEVESTQSPFETVWNYFERYIEAIIDDVPLGEEREYLIFFKNAGRPLCIEAKLIHKELMWEKSITGHPEPYATGSFPYQVDGKPPYFAKKGAFPLQPHSESDGSPSTRYGDSPRFSIKCTDDQNARSRYLPLRFGAARIKAGALCAVLPLT